MMDLLVITKAHPPATTTRSIQVLRLLNELRAQGVRVRVITEGEPSGADVEGITRVPSQQRTYGNTLSGRARHWWTRRTGEVNPFDAWTQAVVRAAMSEIDSRRPDVLVTLSTPFHPHQAGLALRAQYPALPWAAFFSDPAPIGLVGGFWARYRLPGLYQYQLRQTRRVLSEADCILVTNQYISRCFQSLGDSVEGKAMHVVRHIAEPVETVRAVEPGWLTHIGSLDPPRCCEPLLHAVKQLAQKESTFEGLRLVGTVNPLFLRQAKAAGVDHLLDLVGPVPHEKAQEYTQTAQALLLVEADLPVSFFSPSKLAEYAYHERPVFAVTPPISAVRDAMSHFAIGHASSWHDPNMADELTAFWRQSSEPNQEYAFTALQEEFSAATNARRFREAIDGLRHS